MSTKKEYKNYVKLVDNPNKIVYTWVTNQRKEKNKWQNLKEESKM